MTRTFFSPARIAILALSLLFALGLASCKDKEKPFTIEGSWVVTHVREGNKDNPDSKALGTVYEFKDDGECVISYASPAGKTETTTYSIWDDNRQLKIGTMPYQVFEADSERLVFGFILPSGQLGVTYTLKPE